MKLIKQKLPDNSKETQCNDKHLHKSFTQNIVCCKRKYGVAYLFLSLLFAINHSDSTYQKKRFNFL